MRGLAAALVLGLAGCTSGGGETPMIKGVWERVKAARAAKDAPPSVKRSPTRDQIEEYDLALVQMNLAGEDAWPVLFARTANGPYVTYAGQFPQSLTLRESQVTATRGMGTDLISASSSANDPLKVLTPPDDWPPAVSREYRFAGSGPEGRIERYDCTLQRAGPATIALAGTPFDVIGFAETCRGADRQFQNLYAADAKTGRVWQSVQYVGASMPMLTLEVLEPLD